MAEEKDQLSDSKSHRRLGGALAKSLKMKLKLHATKKIKSGSKPALKKR